jgi:hypothetical protein
MAIWFNPSSTSLRKGRGNKMSDTPLWHCQVKPFDGGPALEQLTVGAKFNLECAGDLAVTWQGAPHIEVPEKVGPHTLDIIEVKSLEKNSTQFVVTSYHAGEFKPDYIRVLGSSGGFEANGLQWKIQTVVKQEQGKPPQAYGPIGPFRLPLPSWVWIFVVCILAALVAAVLVSFFKIRRRRRLKADLEKYKSSTPPAAQLQKELRAMGRKLLAPGPANIGEWNTNLDQAIRVYLMLEYKYLTLGEARFAVFSGWRKENRELADQFLPSLRKIYSEMDRFQTHLSEHKAEEYAQILQLVRVWNDKLEKQKVKKL